MKPVSEPRVTPDADFNESCDPGQRTCCWAGHYRLVGDYEPDRHVQVVWVPAARCWMCVACRDEWAYHDTQR